MPQPMLEDPSADVDNPEQADDRLDELESAETEAEHTDQDTEELETVEITGDDLGGSELFDGTEDYGEDESGGAGDPFGEEGDGASPFGEADDGPPEALVEAINEGAARAGVVGLEDGDEKEDLEEEFTEVFETFKLGHFGALTFEEHIKQTDDDIDPVWGLVGAMLICAAVVVYKRPDGDDMIHNAKDSLGNLNGLLGGNDSDDDGGDDE